MSARHLGLGFLIGGILQIPLIWASDRPYLPFVWIILGAFLIGMDAVEKRRTKS